MVTMDEVASKVGVSRATVSFVLNGRRSGPEIGEETKRRVLQAAQELGYRRNEIARSMKSGKTRVVGFIVPDPAWEWVARMLGGAIDEADEQGYFVKVLRSPDGQGARRRPLAEQCAELRLAGAIVLYMQGEPLEKLRAELERQATPLVLLDDHRVESWGAPVITDYAQGMRQAVAHLAVLGHRRIGFVSGAPGEPSSVAREDGFRRAMAEAGLAFNDADLVRGNFETQTTLELTRALLAQSARPTAIVAATDPLAATVLRAARQSGLGVPEDLSVVGFGDLSLAAHCDPPLTTVSQPFYQMGRAAMRRLLHSLAQDDGSGAATIPTFLREIERVPTELIVRESTARLAPISRP